MAFGDPIDIEVTVSGESNTISSFQGGTTTVENYSGGNAIDVTLSDATSATTATSGHNVDVTFSGNSTSVTGPFFLASQSSTSSEFSCSDLTACNLFESGDITGFGNIGISGSGDYLIVSGSAGAATIEVKSKGITKTSAVSSLDFNQGYSVTNVGPAVTIDSNLGIGNLTTAECNTLLAQCEDRNASGIYSGQNGDTFYFRGLIGTGAITVTGYPGNDNFIYISGEQFYPNSNPSGFITGIDSGHLITGASNIGTGSGLYSGINENDLKFKTLIAGPNIVLSGDGQHIMISGTAGGTGSAVSSVDYCNLNKSSATEDINVTYANRVSIGFDNTVSKSSIFSHSTSTNNQRVTVTAGGIYYINASIGFDNEGNNRVSPRASIFKNGSEITETRCSAYSRGKNYGDEKTLQTNTTLELSTDDYLELFAWMDDSDQATAVNTIVGECEFVITRTAFGTTGSGGTTQTAANIGFGSGIYSGTVSDEFKLRSISGAGSVTVTGHEDSTIIVSGAAGGITETGHLVGKGESGIFYSNSNPSGFITGFTETGHLVGKGESGLFYANTNPSGFITGFTETGHLVGKGESGQFYANSNPSGFITGLDTGNFITGIETGHLVGKGESGQFYANSNPSGFISGLIVKDESTKLTDSALIIDFKGAGVSATSPSDGVVEVNVPQNPVYLAEGGGTGAGFSAYLSSDIQVPDGTYTSIGADNVSFDIRNDYNESTFKFHPTVSGRYYINAQSTLYNLGTTQWNEIFISGSHSEWTGIVARNYARSTADEYTTSNVSRIIETPATGEYYEAFVKHTHGSDRTLLANSTFFESHILAEPAPISGVINVGLGTGISSGISGGLIQLRTIQGAGNISITGKVNDHTIYISGDTGNFITGIETGHLVGKGESGQFYANSNPSGFITGLDTGNFITGASNLGTGSGLYSGTITNDLKFKTLIAGPNIVLSGDSEHIMISGFGGTTQTAANIGFGSGIYSGTVSDEFKLRSISGAGSVTVTGHEDNTIIVSGSEVAGGAVSWTLPPPGCPTGIGTTGQISFDDVYYYICIRENTWRRVAISEWSC